MILDFFWISYRFWRKKKCKLQTANHHKWLGQHHQEDIIRDSPWTFTPCCISQEHGKGKEYGLVWLSWWLTLWLIVSTSLCVTFDGLQGVHIWIYDHQYKSIIAAGWINPELFLHKYFWPMKHTKYNFNLAVLWSYRMEYILEVHEGQKPPYEDSFY